jgi:XRE family aerobic/anaerobic benzoate catabolism transcriptional regulator
VAAASGVSERFLALIEAGEANPSLETMAVIAAALRLNVWELLAGDWYPAPRLARLVRGMTLEEQEALADVLEAKRVRSAPGLRVALVGLRGAGKSTIGKLLARRVGVPFIELDRRVEARAGLKLAQLFEIHGEPAYRRLELEVLREVLETQPTFVLETGGGLPSHAEAWALLRGGAKSVWLKTRPEEYLARVLGQGDKRPMAQRPQALTELKALLAAREPAYRLAELHVDTTRQEVSSVVERVADWLAAGVPSAARAK